MYVNNMNIKQNHSWSYTLQNHESLWDIESACYNNQLASILIFISV